MLHCSHVGCSCPKENYKVPTPLRGVLLLPIQIRLTLQQL